MRRHDSWPALPLNEWKDTYGTLHMWTQIVGKIRMTLSPPLNHWWHVALYLNSRGLTTGPIPYSRGIFEIEFDFQRHELSISTGTGSHASWPLRAESVADFYSNVTDGLKWLGIAVEINPKPQEVPDPIPFPADSRNRSYDPEYAHRFWTILVSSANVLQAFRARFAGKCSPVHFFWGSCDLACTRFSGRLAPPRKGVISSPAYSHEVCSAGFWPGGGSIGGPAYYSYTVPQPRGLDQAAVRPAAANWNNQLSEFILMYEDVRATSSPEETLYEFFESTYQAAADLAKWDRAALEI
jgi:hypothetical protein